MSQTTRPGIATRPPRFRPGTADRQSLRSDDQIRAATGAALLQIRTALDGGLRRHETGQLAKAEAIYRLIQTVEEPYADSLHLLGVIAHQRGDLAQSADLIGRALLVRPDTAAYHKNLADTLRDLGRQEDAMAHYRRALALRPNSPEIHNNLGNALRDQGLPREAARHYHMALGLAPMAPEIHYNLANVMADAGDLEDAIVWYRRVLDLSPDFADAHFNLGRTLMALNRPDEAETSYRQALALRPNHPETLNNLGSVLQDQARLPEAMACYATALRLNPLYAEAHYNMGCALLAQNRCDEAAHLFERALVLRPIFGAARLALCMAHLPVLYVDEGEIARRRAAYQNALDALCAEAGQPARALALADGIGAIQPFFLAYQGQNDRTLQSEYGSMVCRVTATAAPPVALTRPPRNDERIRVGIVSGFFNEHTVWRLLIKGWLTQLDRRRFEVLGYHTGGKRDGATEHAAVLSDRFLEGRQPADRWRMQIAADRPHILLYPEIGMDPMAAMLAAHRLAPIQCNAWGHPTSSGMPTIDYFLSSALMEPDDGQDHYTERLVRLPNLGTWYEPDDCRPPPMVRADLGLRADAVVYWCGQALYKYLPQYDQVFPRIARAGGVDCQFVFIDHAKSPAVTDLLRRRLHRVFDDYGLRADDYCLFLRPMDQAHFIAAVGLSDIILDSIGWSGGKSTLDCLAHDRPMVTLAGPLMRSRHTAAILTRMNATTTIATTLDGYIDLAARLARDPGQRAEIRAAVAAGKAKVFYDHAYIAGLEAFLEQAARGQPQANLQPPPEII